MKWNRRYHQARVVKRILIDKLKKKEQDYNNADKVIEELKNDKKLAKDFRDFIIKRKEEGKSNKEILEEGKDLVDPALKAVGLLNFFEKAYKLLIWLCERVGANF